MRQYLCFLLFFFASVSSFGQSFAPAVAGNHQLLNKLVTESGITGLNVAVCYRGELIWQQQYGFALLENETAAAPQSMFRVASVSKLFTGSAILKLRNQGLLNLDDPIDQYLDSIPDAWRDITIRQLAQHSSGIAHYADVADALDTHHYESTREALTRFQDRPLQHEPGQGVTYSSYGYTVLAAVIESVTQQDYHAAMQELIFEPLQMKHTEPDDQRKVIKHRTGFYQYDADRQIINAPLIDLSGRWAGSGYLSTAADLARFGDAHIYGSSFFSKSDLEELTAPQQLNDSVSTREGLGWGQRQGWQGRLMFWGDGKTPGARSKIAGDHG